MNIATTTLDPSFLRAVVLMTGFKPSPMRNAQAALLAIGLRMAEFTAADLPGEVTNGSKHLAGAATGALVATGLLTAIRRINSPRLEAKGRTLDVLTIPDRPRAKAWLRANAYDLEQLGESQGRLF